ncbi:AraC family transcriptional regulator [Paenibacillus baekrokdamisoli]|nr:AraC family transcriptional regulator [Paenibacillus baekrokdamisoli]
MIENYLHRFQAEVSMAAFSNTKPNFQIDEIPNYYSFWHVFRGEGQLTLNDRNYDVKPGHLLMMPPGIPQRFSNSSQPVSIFWCHFRASMGDIQLFDLLKLQVCVEPLDGDSMRRLFTRMIDAFRSTAMTRELRLRAALLDIMACYLEHCELNEIIFQNNDNIGKIDRVLEYIDLHLADNMGIDELARLAYLHPNYFIGFFKNIVGCPPIQYINLRRLERAKQLLEKTSDNILSVADQVGMKNHYLSRLFKQHTGLSPSRYRQIYRTAYGVQSKDEGGSSEDEDRSRPLF